MAFNLTARINVVTQGVGKVARDLRAKLSNIQANVKIRVDPTANAKLQALAKSLDLVNSKLVSIQGTSAASAASITKLSTASNALAVSSNKAAAGQAKTAVAAKATGTAVRTASSEMAEFGRISGLAIRRFAGFTIATGVIFGFISAIRTAVKDAISFEREMVKISQVAGIAVSGLSNLNKEVTRLSTTLGVDSNELLNVARILKQTGLTARETEVALQALARSSLAPTFKDMKSTAEGSIAALRQFQLGVEDLEGALGSINAVAGKFAVEADDIVGAIRRTGGVFAVASEGIRDSTGALVSNSEKLRQFIAIFTSVRSTTRESAESIATGLRTIFTRIQRGTTIKALQEMNINLQDAEGKFVGVFEAVQRLGVGLKGLSPRDTKFIDIVEQLGGFRQIGKVIPLIQRFDVAQRALNVAQQGSKSLAQDAAQAQKSLAVQIVKTKEEFKAFIRETVQTDTFQLLAKGALSFANALTGIAGAFKPILPLIAAFGAFKAISALTQFGSGFFRGIRGGGGVAAAGQRVSGGSATQQANVKSQVANSTLVAANTTALGINTTALSNLTSFIKVRPVGGGGVLPIRRGRGGGVGGGISGGRRKFASGGQVRKRFANAGVVHGPRPRTIAGRPSGAFGLSGVTKNLQVGKGANKGTVSVLPQGGAIGKGLAGIPNQFGAIFLRPGNVSGEIKGRVPLKGIRDSIVGTPALAGDAAIKGQTASALGGGVKGQRAPTSLDYRLSTRGLRGATADKLEHDIESGIVRTIRNGSNTIGTALNIKSKAKIDQGFLKNINIDQTTGNIFEGILARSGVPYDKARGSANASFDFPTGVGADFGSKFNLKPGVPTEAKATMSQGSLGSIQDKVAATIKKKARAIVNTARLNKLKTGVPLSRGQVTGALGIAGDSSNAIIQKRLGSGLSGINAGAPGGDKFILTGRREEGGLDDGTISSLTMPKETIFNAAGVQQAGLAGLDKLNRTGDSSGLKPFNPANVSVVPGSGSGDTVPVDLESGSFVVRQSASIGAGLSGNSPIRAAKGGMIGQNTRTRFATGTGGSGVSFTGVLRALRAELQALGLSVKAVHTEMTVAAKKLGRTADAATTRKEALRPHQAKFLTAESRLAPRQFPSRLVDVNRQDPAFRAIQEGKARTAFSVKARGSKPPTPAESNRNTTVRGLGFGAKRLDIAQKTMANALTQGATKTQAYAAGISAARARVSGLSNATDKATAGMKQLATRALGAANRLTGGVAGKAAGGIKQGLAGAKQRLSGAGLGLLLAAPLAAQGIEDKRVGAALTGTVTGGFLGAQVGGVPGALAGAAVGGVTGFENASIAKARADADKQVADSAKILDDAFTKFAKSGSIEELETAFTRAARAAGTSGGVNENVLQGTDPKFFNSLIGNIVDNPGLLLGVGAGVRKKESQLSKDITLVISQKGLGAGIKALFKGQTGEDLLSGSLESQAEKRATEQISRNAPLITASEKLVEEKIRRGGSLTEVADSLGKDQLRNLGLSASPVQVERANLKAESKSRLLDLPQEKREAKRLEFLNDALAELGRRAVLGKTDLKKSLDTSKELADAARAADEALRLVLNNMLSMAAVVGTLDQRFGELSNTLSSQFAIAGGGRGKTTNTLNTFKNPTAFSSETLDASANALFRQLGPEFAKSEKGQQLRGGLQSSSRLQELLPGFLTELGEDLSFTGAGLEDALRDSFSSNGITGVVAEQALAKAAKIGKANEGASAQDLLRDNPNLVKDLTPDSIETFNKTGAALRDAMNKVFNEFEKGIIQVGNLEAKVNGQRIDNLKTSIGLQNQISTLFGGQLTIAQKTAGVDSSVRELTRAGGGVTSNPRVIGARIESLRTERQELLSRQQGARNVGGERGEAEFRRLGLELNKNQNKLDSNTKAMETLSKDTTKLAAIQSEIQKIQSQRAGAQDITQRLAAAANDPKKALQLRKDQAAFNIIKSGGSVAQADRATGKDSVNRGANFLAGFKRVIDPEEFEKLRAQFTKGLQKDPNFKKFVTPASRKILGIGGTAPGETDEEKELAKDFVDAAKTQVAAMNGLTVMLAKTIPALTASLINLNVAKGADIRASGEPKRSGGFVGGKFKGNRDTELTKLVPGEFVVKRSVAQRNKNELTSLNSGGTMPGFRRGGKTRRQILEARRIQRADLKKNRRARFLASHPAFARQAAAKKARADKARIARSKRPIDTRPREVRKREHDARVAASAARRGPIGRGKATDASRAEVARQFKLRRSARVSAANKHARVADIAAGGDRPKSARDIEIDRLFDGGGGSSSAPAPIRRRETGRSATSTRVSSTEQVRLRAAMLRADRANLKRRNAALKAPIPTGGSGTEPLVDYEKQQKALLLQLQQRVRGKDITGPRLFNQGGTVSAVTPGEFVASKPLVDSMPPGFFEKLNNGGSIPGFNDGGGFKAVSTSSHGSGMIGGRSRSDPALQSQSSASPRQSIEGLDGFAVSANKIASAAEQFAKLVIPERITIEIAPVQMVVTLNGAEALTNIKENLGDFVQNKIVSEVKKHINTVTGETNESFG